MDFKEMLEGAAFGITDGIIAVLGTLIGAAAATESTGLAIIAGIVAGVSNSFANGIGVYISQSTERSVQIAKQEDGEQIQVHSVRENIISALSAFTAAITVSLLMVVPFLFLEISSAMFTCFILGVGILFVLGILTAKISKESMLVHGVQYAFLGVIGAVIGFVIGDQLKNLIVL
jgi:predicted membrane protein (TIGR00267 family)